eukprot:364999-Chlamydomonas_euryale.AAC.3
MWSEVERGVCLDWGEKGRTAGVWEQRGEGGGSETARASEKKLLRKRRGLECPVRKRRAKMDELFAEWLQAWKEIRLELMA